MTSSNSSSRGLASPISVGDRAVPERFGSQPLTRRTDFMRIRRLVCRCFWVWCFFRERPDLPDSPATTYLVGRKHGAPTVLSVLIGPDMSNTPRTPPQRKRTVQTLVRESIGPARMGIGRTDFIRRQNCTMARGLRRSNNFRTRSRSAMHRGQIQYRFSFPIASCFCRLNPCVSFILFQVHN